MGLHF
jgi:hypothetical protein